MVKTNYQCEKCEACFNNIDEAVVHEAMSVNPTQLLINGLYKVKNISNVIGEFYDIGIVLRNKGIGFHSGEHIRAYDVLRLGTDENMEGLNFNANIIKRTLATEVEELTEEQAERLNEILNRHISDTFTKSLEGIGVEYIIRGKILKE